MNEEFTLAEAMEAVDEYLAESGKGFHKYINKMAELEKNSSELTSRAMAARRDACRAKNPKQEALLYKLGNKLGNNANDKHKYIINSYGKSNDANGKKTNNIIPKDAEAFYIRHAASDLQRAKQGADSRGEYKNMDPFGKRSQNALSMIRNDLKSRKPGPDNRPITERYPSLKKSIKKESVDDLDTLRLQVYEAFDEGAIDAEEKANMLELLNLDNYITEE